MVGVNSLGASSVTSLTRAFESSGMTTTGAKLISGSNNNTQLSVATAVSTPAHTRADASANLERTACRAMLGMDASTVRGGSDSGGALVDHAVNLYMLGQVDGNSKSASFIEVRDALASVAAGHGEKGEKSFSVTWSVSKGSGYKAHQKLEKMIDKLVSESPDVFCTAAKVTHLKDLRDGLPVARELAMGIQLSDASRNDSSQMGNASDVATSVVFDLLKAAETTKNGRSLTQFIHTMLNQLDLGADQKQAQGQKQPSTRAASVGVLPNNQHGANIGGSVGDISIRTGDTQVDVKIDGLVEVAGALCKALDLLSGQLVVARNLASNNQGSEHNAPLPQSSVLNAKGAEGHKAEGNTPKAPAFPSSVVHTPSGFDEGGSDLKTVVPLNFQSARGVDSPGSSLLVVGGIDEVDNPKLVRSLSSPPRGGDSLTGKRRRLTGNSLTSEHISSGGVQRLGSDASSPRRSMGYELNPERMRGNVPDASAFQGMGKRTLDYVFFEGIAAGVCGHSKDEVELKNYILEGKDPSKAESGSSIHKIYQKAKSQSSGFAVRLEAMYDSYRKSRSAPVAPAQAGRVVTSPGSSSAPSGMSFVRQQSV